MDGAGRSDGDGGTHDHGCCGCGVRRVFAMEVKRYVNLKSQGRIMRLIDVGCRAFVWWWVLIAVLLLWAAKCQVGDDGSVTK